MKKQLISETALLQSVYKLRQYMSEGPATGQPPAPLTRYKTPAEYDAEIARFSKTSNPALAANKKYIDSLNAEKAVLMKQQAGQGAKATPGATPLPKGVAPSTAGGGRGVQGGPTAAQAAQAGQGAKASAPKVGYEKDFPEATAKELQTKLNAAGEKLTVDGKMGPATRAAMARHPEITSQSPESQAVSADYKSANTDPTQSTAPAAAAMAAMGQAATTAANATAAVPPAVGQGAQPSAPAAAPAPAAPAAAPAVNPNNPFGPKTDPKVAAWEKLSPEQQKWMGGADPTDPIILARMRAAVPDKAPAAAPAAAPAPAGAAGYAPKAVAESAYSDLDRIMSIVQYR